MRIKNLNLSKSVLGSISGVAVAALLTACGGAVDQPNSSSSSSGQASNGGSSSSSSSGTTTPVPTPKPTNFELVAGTNIEAPVSDCNELTATPEMLLTNVQYANAIHDIFLPLNVDVMAEAEKVVMPETLSAFDIKQLEKLVAPAADMVSENINSLGLGCSSGENCAKQFVEKFARRAFRGSPDQEDINYLMDNVFAAEDDFKSGINQLTRAILMDARTLYRYEQGVAGQGAVVLSARDKATKLSLLLTNSIPDDTLLEAAENGELNSQAGFKKQVDRLVETDDFLESLNTFHHHWMELEYGSATPVFDSAVVEFDHLVKHFYKQNGTIRDLYSTNVGFVNKELAEVYGIDSTGMTNDQFKQVQLDDRPGLLLRSAFLTITSGDPELTSPTERGLVIANRVLCAELAEEAPADIQTKFPVLPRIDGLNTRQEMELVLEEDVVCKFCHDGMDPFGFAFENYDGSGRYRTTEEGVTIDAVVNDSLIGPINGALDFVEKVKNDREVADCYVQNWFEHSFLQNSGAKNSCVLRRIQDNVAASDGSLSGLIYELVNNPAFHYREL